MALDTTEDHLCAQIPHNFYRTQKFLTSALFAAILDNMQQAITSVYFLANLQPSLIYQGQITVHMNKQPFLGTPALEMRGIQGFATVHFVLPTGYCETPGSRLPGDLGREHDPLCLLCLPCKVGRTLCKIEQ